MAAILSCRAMLNQRPLRRGCLSEFLYPTARESDLGMPRSATQLPPKPYAQPERAGRRHERPCRERQQGDGDDQLDIAERVLADTRAKARGERLSAVSEFAERRGVSGQRVPVALATVGDGGKPSIETVHARCDAADRVRRRRQRRRSEDADRAKLRLEGGQVRPRFGDCLLYT